MWPAPSEPDGLTLGSAQATTGCTRLGGVALRSGCCGTAAHWDGRYGADETVVGKRPFCAFHFLTQNCTMRAH